MRNVATKKTASARKACIVLILLGVSVFVCAAAWLLWPRNVVPVRIGTATVDARLALTTSEQRIGLGGQPQIDEHQAMLFVFPRDAVHTIWMKDMQFAIDIIWLDKDKKVVWLAENATPASYPHLFTPPGDSRYVLEAASGTAKKFSITVGVIAAFSLPAYAK